MNFDFIATSRPVDQVAARVLSPGEHYDPGKCQSHAMHSDLPIPTRPFPGLKEHNLTGFRKGSLVVKGYAAEQDLKGKKSRWVVRCDCGYYEIRTAKSLKNPNNDDDRCAVCRDLAWIRRHDQRRRETA